MPIPNGVILSDRQCNAATVALIVPTYRQQAITSADMTCNTDRVTGMQCTTIATKADRRYVEEIREGSALVTRPQRMRQKEDKAVFEVVYLCMYRRDRRQDVKQEMEGN